MSLGKRLKEVRQKRKLTQIEVMKKTGINNKTLSGYENGVSNPDFESLKKLANLYKVSIDQLLEAEELFNMEADYEFRNSLEKLLDEAMVGIYQDGKFIPAISKEVRQIEERFEDYLDIGEKKLTPQLLRELVINASWKDENLQHLLASFLSISRNYMSKHVKELTEFLNMPNITYKGHLLSEEDIKRIYNMLDILLNVNEEES